MGDVAGNQEIAGKQEIEPEEPKKPQVAYFLFMSAKREEIMKELGNPGRGGVAKVAGDRWKAMSEAEKAPFEQKAVEEKKKYEEALADFKAKNGKVGKRAAEKREKRQNAKRSKTGLDDDAISNMKNRKPSGGPYGQYMQMNRDEIKKLLPAGAKCVECNKKGAEQWDKLSAEEKQKYEQLYAEKLKKYEIERKAIYRKANQDPDWKP